MSFSQSTDSLLLPLILQQQEGIRSESPFYNDQDFLL